ncbi:MAG: nickel pincer cofactor biosynthesis protein LarB [Clostridia bacterium]|nr:nickel pincer cofactor biosynthesis protein LarB [Clostridia bacterium]MEE0182183.1 nickel pincer cofactor biosynthesis protein LarB [Anaerovoracaceae bacterium]
MDREYLLKLCEDIRADRISCEDAADILKELPFKDMEFARIDNHRSLRTGYPEVVFCQGKTDSQIADIMELLWQKNSTVMGTRATEANYSAVRERLPEAEYFEQARIIAVSRKEADKKGSIAVITAGTSDIPVAEEAAVTAEILGNNVSRIYDVGVAGIHRLFDSLDEIRKANAVIVCAGMEGALASVTGGLVDVPVIAVPTSIGYGASFNGLAALLSMLNSCANGISVVNIDNGFGAAYTASMINRGKYE